MVHAQGWRHEDRRRLARFEMARQPFRLNEGDVSRTGLAQRPGVVDDLGAVAVNLSVDQCRQLLDGDHHCTRPSFLKGASNSLLESGPKSPDDSQAPRMGQSEV